MKLASLRKYDTQDFNLNIQDRVPEGNVPGEVI